MAICKECGTKNPDESKFCSECGGVLATIDAAAVQAALDKVEKEFEKDAKVCLDRSRLTYICDICGKVNPIDTPDKRCTRCGKKMPRSEYIKALQRIKDARAVQQNLIEEMPADRNLPAPPAQTQAPVQKQESAPQQKQVLYRMNANAQSSGGVRQNNQIVQPFVIVPYVSQNQPLLQYNPNSVYRYHEYSDSEKRRNHETLARLQKEREEAERQRIREEERLARLESEGRSQAGIRKERKFRTADYGFKKPNGWITALFSFICAAVAIFFAIMFPIAPEVSFSSFIGGMDVFFETLTNEGIVSFVGLAIYTVAMIGLFVTAIVRFFKKSFKRKQLLFPSIALIGTIVALVGCALDSTLFNEKGMVFQIVMIATSVIAFVSELLTRTSKQVF